MPRFAQGGPEWVEISGPITFADGSTAAANWPELATDDERSERGVATIVEAEIGPGLRVVDRSLQDVSGAPHEVCTTEAIEDEAATPTAAQLRAALSAAGMTTEQVDALFQAAASL